jgi:hypothetical protein
VKFVKGKWRIGDDVIEPGTKFIAYMPQALRGWVKFENGKVTDRRIGKTSERFQMPEREELGDLDPTKWEIGPDGKPRDPWGEQRYLPLLGVDDDRIVTYVTGSASGKIAIQDLNRRYGFRLPTTQLPIVALAVREYQHKVYGLMEAPRFNLVGWTDPSGEPPAAAVGNEMNDEIPF